VNRHALSGQTPESGGNKDPQQNWFSIHRMLNSFSGAFLQPNIPTSKNRAVQSTAWLKQYDKNGSNKASRMVFVQNAE